MKHALTTFIVLPLVMAFLGCSTPLTTREKGAGIGALGGAAAGGIIGSAVHHPAAGALIGGALGAGGGAVLGDQLRGQGQSLARSGYPWSSNSAEFWRPLLTHSS